MILIKVAGVKANSVPSLDVFDSQTQPLCRSRLVCHCATQLKLEGVESNGHNCGH